MKGFNHTEWQEFHEEYEQDIQHPEGLWLYHNNPQQRYLRDDATIKDFHEYADRTCTDFISCPLGDACLEQVSEKVRFTRFLNISANRPLWLKKRVDGLKETRLRFSTEKGDFFIHVCKAHHNSILYDEDWACSYPVIRDTMLYDSDVQALELMTRPNIAQALKKGVANMAWRGIEHQHGFHGVQTARIIYNGEYRDELDEITELDRYVFSKRPDLLENAIERKSIPSGLEVEITDRNETYQDWVFPPVFAVGETLAHIARIPYLHTYDAYGYPISKLYRDIMMV